MVKVKCSKCGYTWDCLSKLKMVTCPSCNAKTKKSAIGNKNNGADKNKNK